MNAHPSRQAADLILDKAEERGRTFTPMQILKLVYLCHGWMLGLHGRPLISEPVEAWRYGPVIRDLYHGVKKFRSNPVEKPLFVSGSAHDFDEAEKDIVGQVADVYGDMSGIRLSRLTHARGTPWHITWHSGGRNSVISNDLIEHHFCELGKDGG